MIRDEIRPFVRASRPAGARAQAGRERPRGADAEPHAHVHRAQRRSSTCSPTTRRAKNDEGYLFWLSWLNHLGPGGVRQPGRARPDPARRRDHQLPEPAAARERRARQPAARRAGRAARGARAARRSARARPASAARERAADAEVRPQLRPDRPDGGLRALLLRPAAVPLARVRRPGAAQAEGLPGQRVVRAGVAARDGGGRADLRRPGRQGQGDRAGRRDRPRRRDDGAAVARTRRCRRTRGDPAPEDAAGGDLRRADARHADAPKLPEGGSLPAGRGLGHRRAGRDPAHVRPARRARRSSTGRRPRPRRSPAAGATSTTRSATSGRSRTTPPSSSTSSTARSRRCGR